MLVWPPLWEARHPGWLCQIQPVIICKATPAPNVFGMIKAKYWAETRQSKIKQVYNGKIQTLTSPQTLNFGTEESKRADVCCFWIKATKYFSKSKLGKFNEVARVLSESWGIKESGCSLCMKWQNSSAHTKNQDALVQRPQDTPVHVCVHVLHVSIGALECVYSCWWRPKVITECLSQ